MRKISNDTPFPYLPRVKQISVAHCGPAVLEMLLGNYGIRIPQQQLVAAAGVAHKLSQYGITVGELGRAIKNLVPGVIFWVKENASVDDLKTLVVDLQYPAGVEWQGMFGKYSDDDDGHYSTITFVDLQKNTVCLADPYHHFAGHDRVLPLHRFEKRWWETNEITDPHTGKHRLVKDDHIMFTVTPKNIARPSLVGMKPMG